MNTIINKQNPLKINFKNAYRIAHKWTKYVVDTIISYLPQVTLKSRKRYREIKTLVEFIKIPHHSGKWGVKGIISSVVINNKWVWISRTTAGCIKIYYRKKKGTINIRTNNFVEE